MTKPDWRDRYYGAMADERSNDHDVAVKYAGKLTMSEGATGRAANLTPGFGAYGRFHRTDDVVWVTDLYGKQRWLTRNQAEVLDYARSMIDRGQVTVRSMATALGLAPSTVSRALAKLMGYGLIAYLMGRGRYAGALFFSRSKGDTFERLAVAARERVRRWRMAADARVSRLASNVASCLPWTEVGAHTGDLKTFYENVYVQDATLKPWTAQEIAEAVGS